MWERSNQLKKGLEELGYYIGSGDSPICAVFTPVGENLEDVGMGMLKYLRSRDVSAPELVWPVIPPGLVMFRMILPRFNSRKKACYRKPGKVIFKRHIAGELHLGPSSFPVGLGYADVSLQEIH